MMRVSKALLALALWGLALPALAYDGTGTEDRCVNLGAQCACSEPFNAPSYSGNVDFNPSDTTGAKQCDGWNGSTNNVIEMYNDIPPGSNSIPVAYAIQPSLLPKIKSGTGLQFYVGGPDGAGQIVGGQNYFIFNVSGHSSNVPTGHMAKSCARWYYYHSDTRRGDAHNHDWGVGAPASEGCQQSNKILHGDGWQAGNAYITSGNANRSLESDGWNNGFWGAGSGILQSNVLWSPAGQVSCGPGTDNLWCGNWIRMEQCIDMAQGATSGNGARYRLYWKNVTDDTPERLIMDTYEPNTWAAAHSVNGNTSLMIGSTWQDHAQDNYRQHIPSGPNAGICDGWRGVSHYMIAGWSAAELTPGYNQFAAASNELDCDLNCNNRIGAAIEMEGGTAGPDTDPPTRTNTTKATWATSEQVTISMTSVDATPPVDCTWNPAQNVPYGDPGSTTFANQSGGLHSHNLGYLSAGSSARYARCQDNVTPTPNTNTTDTSMPFTVTQRPQDGLYNYIILDETNPGNFDTAFAITNAVDESLTTFARSNNNNSYLQLLTHEGDGTSAGLISAVRVRIYWDTNGTGCTPHLIPYFNGTAAGGDHALSQPFPVEGTPAWSPYIDITNDTNAPSPWTWAAVRDLNLRVSLVRTASRCSIYAAQVAVIGGSAGVSRSRGMRRGTGAGQR